MTEPNKIPGGYSGPGAGLAAAVADAVASAGPLLPLRDPEQLDLLGDRRPTREAVEQLPRGRGRPPGARNKSTEDLRAYLGSRYTHPVETLLSISTQPVDKLAAELGCKPIEALTLIQRAAAEAAPYMMGKAPLAIDMTVRGDMMLAIAGLTHTAEEVATIAQGEFVDVDADDEEAGDFSGLDDAAGTGRND